MVLPLVWLKQLQNNKRNPLWPEQSMRAPKEATEFRLFYDRGYLPLQVAFDGASKKVQWKVNFDKLDCHHYLPVFFDGIREQ